MQACSQVLTTGVQKDVQMPQVNIFLGVFSDFFKQCLVCFYSGIWLFLLHCVTDQLLVNLQQFTGAQERHFFNE